MEKITVYLNELKKRESLICCLNNVSWGEGYHSKTAFGKSERVSFPGDTNLYWWALVNDLGAMVFGVLEERTDKIIIIANCDLSVRQKLMDVLANVFKAPVFSTITIN